MKGGFREIREYASRRAIIFGVVAALIQYLLINITHFHYGWGFALIELIFAVPYAISLMMPFAVSFVVSFFPGWVVGVLSPDRRPLLQAQLLTVLLVLPPWFRMIQSDVGPYSDIWIETLGIASVFAGTLLGAISGARLSYPWRPSKTSSVAA